LWSNTLGTQLLAWSELQKTCNRIQICYLNVESRQILSGNWSEMTSGGCSNFPIFYRNPFILVPPLYLKKMVLILGHTNDQRHERTVTDVKFDYAQLGITIIQLKSHTIPTHDNYDIICQSKFWNKREISLAIDIEPKQGQQYAIVLSTYYPNINASFWLQLFSKQLLPTLELRIWTNVYHQTVQTIHGEWCQENAGGRRTKSTTSTFYQNPAYLLTVSDTSSVRLILHQSFQTFVPLAQYQPIGIYVLSTTANEEPTFVRARSVSRLVHLTAGEEYYVVPACFEANTFGHFELNVLCDVKFTLDPTERKLTPPPPPPPPPESKASTLTTTTKKPVTTRTKEVPKRGSLALAKARLSALTDKYTDMDIIE
jgi:hypothetical protein